MSHIVESCPLTKLDGRLKKLHSVDDESVEWLSSYGMYGNLHMPTTTTSSEHLFYPSADNCVRCVAEALVVTST